MAADPLDLGDADPGGLLDEDVGTRLERPARDPGQLVVDGRDDDDVGPQREHLVEGPARPAAEIGGEARGRRGTTSWQATSVVGTERGGPLAADEPAADDPDPQRPGRLGHQLFSVA